MENKNIEFLKQSNHKLLCISHSKDLVDFLTEQNTHFILVDDMDRFDFLNLEYIFSDKKIIVFVNDIVDSKLFNSCILDILLKYFELNDDGICDCLIYSSSNFPYKKDIDRLSDINKKSLFNVSNKDTILYLGQSGTCGYAVAAKGYICDYFLKNNNVTWKPLYFDNSKNDSQYYVDVISESCIHNKFDEYDLFLLHSTPDIWKRECKLHKRLKIKKTVGYCTWETNRLPKDWVGYINDMEEVWVPSNFNKETFINSGVTSNIQVVPHVWHRQELFDKKNVTLTDYFGNIIPRDKYTFYSIGELNHRKGIDDLIRVFNKIKDVRPDCQLILKLHHKQYNVNNYYKCVKKVRELSDSIGKSIYLILDNLSNREMLMLHSFGDCYVSLNKGEGFGLTIFDVVNYNNDIITTKYGGPLDYISDMNQLVDCELKSVDGMEKFSKQYTSDQIWAHPNLDCAYEMMLSKVN
jgi:glycosyltransferase involved in cell wall biosynthesis